MTVQVRDIHIDLSNSCNCCLPRRNPFMYINHEGLATPYQRSKSPRFKEAMVLSIKNLYIIIEANSQKFGREFYDLKSDVEDRIKVSLDERSPPRVTLDLILKINDAIKDILVRGSDETT